MSFFKRMSRKEEAGAESFPEEGTADEGTPDSVPGERGVAAVNRPPSLQSRLSNMMAVGLMSTLALGFLGWYYVHVVATRRGAASASQLASRKGAQAEMPLPPLGRVDPPRLPEPAASHTDPSTLEQILGPPPEEPAKTVEAMRPIGNGSAAPYIASAPASKTPSQLALERRLAGPVFSGPSSTVAGSQPTSALGEPMARAMAVSDRPAEAGDLSSLLRPSPSAASEARVLPTQRLLLSKGAFLDCTLETAIDSTLPGMTTCVLATDTFGVDGSVVLLERGTKLVGETRGQVRQGSARIFVLWTEARTPRGVVVPLASPGTDELGRSGLSGEVDRHFWDRFGAAILVSVIDGAVQAAAQSNSNGGTVIYNPTTSRDVMTEVLRSTIDIPPTVTKANGDRIQVLVARDLDFRTVYELRPIATDR